MMRILLIPIISFLFFSCKQPRKNTELTPDTPKALQEKSSSEAIFSKRSYPDDLVESLYSELTDKTPELKDLEEMISKLEDQKSDSVESFKKFDQKNTSYYNSANQHLQQIKDSLIRKKIKSIIDSSLSAYNSKTRRYKNLISTLYLKEINLEDLHIVLKLVKTLQLIEKYQKENIPSTKSIEKVIEGFDKAIQKTDTLTKE